MFARNLKTITCRIEINSRTYKTLDYGRGEEYSAIHLTKMKAEMEKEITMKPR